MSTDSNESLGNTAAPEGASDAFRDFIEERYLEWDREFGEEMHQQRAVSLEPNPEQS